MERYWTLRYLTQEALSELDAQVMKEGLVRAETLPLVFRALGTEQLPRGARVRVRLTGIDLLTLDVHASLVTRLDESAAAAQAEEGDEAEEAAQAAPLALAIDVQDADNPADSSSVGAAASGS
jgi:exoribonuclease-2